MRALLAESSTPILDSLETDVLLINELTDPYRDCDLMIRSGALDYAAVVVTQANKALDERDDDHAMAVLELTTPFLPKLEVVADGCDRL